MITMNFEMSISSWIIYIVVHVVYLGIYKILNPANKQRLKQINTAVLNLDFYSFILFIIFNQFQLINKYIKRFFNLYLKCTSILISFSINQQHSTWHILVSTKKSILLTYQNSDTSIIWNDKVTDVTINKLYTQLFCCFPKKYKI